MNYFIKCTICGETYFNSIHICRITNISNLNKIVEETNIFKLVSDEIRKVHREEVKSLNKMFLENVDYDIDNYGYCYIDKVTITRSENEDFIFYHFDEIYGRYIKTHRVHKEKP